MKKSLLILPFVLFASGSFAQEDAGSLYWKSASEIIFSLGDVTAEADGVSNVTIDVNPIVRFSAFFHLQQQLHYDFTNGVGMFTGLGIRNVGMINDLNDSIKLKQRVYSLGIPVAVKFGNFKEDYHIALGGEFELFFHYKQKVFYDDDKQKSNEWFSDKVNLFNPSAFLDIQFPRGTYLRFKYYFNDFLVRDKQNVKVNGVPYGFFPSESKLFYIAVGGTIKHRSNKRSTPSGAGSGTSTMLY